MTGGVSQSQAASARVPAQNATLRRVFVAGYGSPIRGDDAIGALVADRLLDEVDAEHVEVFSRHVLTAELVEPLRRCSLAIFLDAAHEDPVGEVVCRRLAPANAMISPMAHFLDPQELLAWCQCLYGSAPPAYLLSVQGVSFDYANYTLSPTASAAADRMTRETHRLIREHLAEANATPARNQKAQVENT
jgi:hydrogenase maturation protease